MDIVGIATIRRGGCIIRSRLLERIKEALESDPKLDNLLLAPFSRAAIEAGQANWRDVIATATTHGIAVPALSASLAYFDSLRRGCQPISCKPSATFSARTNTSAWPAIASSTRIGRTKLDPRRC
jgi:6-phosphogluconate dehydrogenase